MKQAKMVQNENGERLIKITFPFSYEDLEKVRSIPGRKYYSQDKCWSAPLHVETIAQLQNWNFEIDESLKTYVQKIDQRKAEILTKDIQGLKLKPYPFQNEGVAFIESKNGRALIADEMGLGKTIEALVYLQLHPEDRPAIIITPASLKYNWKIEAEKWLHEPKIQIISGKKIVKINADIIIINYDVLSNNFKKDSEDTKKLIEIPFSGWVDHIKKINPKIIFTDEGHYFKSDTAHRTKAVKKLAKGIKKFVVLTGTPIENRPAELWNAINIIDPTLFPNKWFFLQRFCNPKNNGFGMTFNGATHLDELHSILKRIMIRRLKKDVLKDLPEKRMAIIPLEINNWNEYQRAEKDLIAFIRDLKGNEAALRASRAKQFAMVETLKQLTIKGKLKDAIDWINDYIEIEGKLVIFVTHLSTLDELEKAFPKISVRMDGSTQDKKKQEIVNAFQTDEKIKLFMGIIDKQARPAGVGWTLTAASATATLEFQWNASSHDQADARVHRIGQKNAVINYYLIAKDTIDERLAEIIDTKKKISSNILDGKEVDENSLLTELINQYV